MTLGSVLKTFLSGLVIHHKLSCPNYTDFFGDF